jgi:hypothetical protein
MKNLITILSALCLVGMVHCTEIGGPFWTIRTDALRLVEVKNQLRDSRKVLDEPWVVSEIEYRLESDRATVVVTEGRVGVLDPRHRETSVIASNTIRTERFAAAFLACKEDGQYVLGLSVQPRREAREPDRGNAAVYFSVRAAVLNDAIATLDTLVAQSGFCIGPYGKAEPADQALTAFVKEELRRVTEASK